MRGCILSVFAASEIWIEDVGGQCMRVCVSVIQVGAEIWGWGSRTGCGRWQDEQ